MLFFIKKVNKLFLFVLASYMLSGFVVCNPLLKVEKVQSKEIDTFPRTWNGAFCINQDEIAFSYEQGFSKLAISLSSIPLFLSKQEQAKMAYNPSKAAYFYEYKQSGWLSFIKNEKKAVLDYYIHKPREIESKTLSYKSLTHHKLECWLKNKKVLFYTGAGISLKNGVWAMNELMENLYLKDIHKNISTFLSYALNNPQHLLNRFNTFCKRAFEADPTPAHEALAKIVCTGSIGIITENFDFLQERAGIKAHKISSHYIHDNNISEDNLKEIDAVVCIGLSHDDRGFIGWYKECNPNGIIAAIDLKCPNYIDEDDFWLEGDCHKILPLLEKSIISS